MFDYNLHGHHHRASGPVDITDETTVGVRFERVDNEATAVVFADGIDRGTAAIDGVLRMISAQGMEVGRDPGSPVCDDYPAPFPFTGTMRRLVFDIPERRRHDTEATAAGGRGSPRATMTSRPGPGTEEHGEHRVGLVEGVRYPSSPVRASRRTQQTLRQRRSTRTP